MFKSFINKKKKYINIPVKEVKTVIPEGIMNKCPQCGDIQYHKKFLDDLKICKKCDYHSRLNALERIDITLDEETFIEYDRDLVSSDPIQFPGYAEKLNRMGEKTGLQEAVVTGEGSIGGFPVVIGIMSFDFFAGTMGSVVGEKLSRAIRTALEKRYPLIIFSTSGGARMEEGIFSLMQMAKTTSELNRFNEEGGFFVSIITDPTLGGVSASFAMLGDIILAEKGAVFGFAGRRVIEQTMRQKLPDYFQTPAFNLQHGQIDQVVHRKELKNTLVKLLELHS